jgi:hypothetical protein
VITGLCKVTLRALDLGALERFYAHALGLDVLSRDEEAKRPRPRAGFGGRLWRAIRIASAKR